MKVATSIDEYLAGIEVDEARSFLSRLREIVHEEEPGAEERISYGMPTFRIRGKDFFWCAAFKKHCSVFGQPMAEFEEELKAYKTSKGTIQFPIGQPVPEDLIRRLIRASLSRI